MDRYKENAKWLAYFAPFRALSISAAYLTPFFLQHGLSLSQVFLLQSVYSGAALLWELPSGYIADRFGRAFSIKLSVPVAAVAMLAYGFSTQFWQFVIWELLLALANGLISGVDTALLMDSLKASGREHQFVKLSQRIDAFGYAATALGVPVSLLLVHFISVSSTIVADGLLLLVGVLLVLRLQEAPAHEVNEAEHESARLAVRQLGRNPQARWLIVLGSVLTTATYLSFWLSAPYYASMGIPVVLFGALLAARSLWKAFLAHRFTHQKHLERNLFAYAMLAGLVFFAMATRQLWLAWLVLGHDVVQALHPQPVAAELNIHISHRHRATLNSMANLVRRLTQALAGPLVGLLVDRMGLSAGLVATGMVCGLAALLAVSRLHALGTFRRDTETYSVTGLVAE